MQTGHYNKLESPPFVGRQRKGSLKYTVSDVLVLPTITLHPFMAKCFTTIKYFFIISRLTIGTIRQQASKQICSYFLSSCRGQI